MSFKGFCTKQDRRSQVLPALANPCQAHKGLQMAPSLAPASQSSRLVGTSITLVPAPGPT